MVNTLEISANMYMGLQTKTTNKCYKSEHPSDVYSTNTHHFENSGLLKCDVVLAIPNVFEECSASIFREQ
jgi:hypothetical protein